MNDGIPTELTGACHCGAVTVALRLSRAPADIELRACQCGFCRRHGAKSLADPDGMLTITAPPGALRRYRFGLRTADFLLCGTCGCYLAAVAEKGHRRRATLNVAGVGFNEFAERSARPVSYDGEDAAARMKRRLENWMPVRIAERDRVKPARSVPAMG